MNSISSCYASIYHYFINTIHKYPGLFHYLYLAFVHELDDFNIHVDNLLYILMLTILNHFSNVLHIHSSKLYPGMCLGITITPKILQILNFNILLRTQPIVHIYYFYYFFIFFHISTFYFYLSLLTLLFLIIIST